MIKIKDIFKGDDRTNKYKKNIVLLIMYQVLGMAVNLMLVPITLNYLGLDEFGIWVTLTTIIGWFSVFDIGLGHGLRNKYAESKAKNNVDDMKKYVSTAIFTMVAISLFIFLFFLLVSIFIDWSIVLNAPSSFAHVLEVLAISIAAMFCIRLVVSIINSLFTADQEPSVPALIAFIGQVLSLITVYLITLYTKPSILYIGLALTASQLFPLIFAFIYSFSTRYHIIYPSLKFFSKLHVRSIFSLGIRFFLIQITTLILFQSNNIVIAHVCGLKEVSEFNVAYKYLSMLSIFFAAFLSPLWSASTDAYVKGETDWIINSIKKLERIWGLVIFGGILMVVLSPLVYNFWLKNAILPNFTLLTLLLGYFLFFARSNMFRSFMNGIGKIKLQFYVTVVEAIIHIPITIILGKYWGIIGIVMSMAFWQIVNSIWDQIQFRRIMNKTARGIWDQ